MVCSDLMVTLGWWNWMYTAPPDDPAELLLSILPSSRSSRRGAFKSCTHTAPPFVPALLLVSVLLRARSVTPAALPMYTQPPEDRAWLLSMLLSWSMMVTAWVALGSSTNKHVPVEATLLEQLVPLSVMSKLAADGRADCGVLPDVAVCTASTPYRAALPQLFVKVDCSTSRLLS